MSALTRFTGGVPAQALIEAGQKRLATRQVSGGDVQYIYQNSNTGFWGIGRDRVPMPDDMELAVNVPSAQIGWCFWQASKVIDRRVVPYFSDQVLDITAIEAETNHTKTQDKDGWSRTIEIDFADVGGSIDGIIRWNPTSDGAVEAVENVIDATVKRMAAGETACIPVVVKDEDPYKHSQGHTIHKPVLKIVRWVSEAELVGGEPEPEAAETGDPFA